MPTRQEDLAFGIPNETRMLNTIQSLVGQPLERQGSFDVMDYANKGRTVYVELKSRRIRHDQYPTAIIGLNKVEWCRTNPGKDYYFCFSYTDGLYYVKYDDALFKTFDRNMQYLRGDREDCANNPNAIVYIPSSKLQKFSL